MKRIAYTRVLAGMATSAAGASGIFTLATWWSGHWRIATFGSRFLPMAPITGLLFAVLGCAVTLWLFWPRSRTVRVGGPLAALLGLLVGLLELSRKGVSFSLPWDQWLITSPSRVGPIPHGQMAPLTVWAFLLSAGALLVYSTRGLAVRPLATAATLAAAASLAIGTIVVASYVSGASLPYDAHTLPMAWLTGLAFMGLNGGLLLGGPVGELPRG